MISVKKPGYKTTILLAYTLMLPPQPNIISLTPVYDAVTKKTTSLTETTESPTAHESPAALESFSISESPVSQKISTAQERYQSEEEEYVKNYLAKFYLSNSSHSLNY